jgi:hypothetical protein
LPATARPCAGPAACANDERAPFYPPLPAVCAQFGFRVRSSCTGSVGSDGHSNSSIGGVGDDGGGNSSATGTASDSAANAAALGNALAVTMCVPWTLCFVAYSFLHCVYAKDKRLQAEEATGDASHASDTSDATAASAKGAHQSTTGPRRPPSGPWIQLE